MDDEGKSVLYSDRKTKMKNFYTNRQLYYIYTFNLLIILPANSIITEVDKMMLIQYDLKYCSSSDFFAG